MKFTPKSEQELQEDRMLPKGEYDFEVVGAEARVSKSGNDMIEIELRVFRPDGGTIHITDYLLEAMLYKLLHFCAATGLTPLYEKGALLPEDCIGKCGRVKLKEERKEGYAPRNAVADYVKPKEGEIPKVAPAKDADEGFPWDDADGDEIPL